MSITVNSSQYAAIRRHTGAAYSQAATHRYRKQQTGPISGQKAAKRPQLAAERSITDPYRCSVKQHGTTS